MTYFKEFDNGLRLIVNKINGVYSVSTGVIVRVGSSNETESENGLSHFIEHNLFKGTINRTSFEISDFIDRIGAQINAYTSKERTCYYTKSTSEHFKDTLEVLSDIYFNSTFVKEEMEKEKGVIIEEINMSEDTPEDICFDLLAESFFGKEGLGRTILGPTKNIRKFNKQNVLDYMDKYYTSYNTVVSVSGNVDIDETVNLVEKLFASKFTNCKKSQEAPKNNLIFTHLHKTKPIEQTHIAMAMKGISYFDKRCDALEIATNVLGGGMSSRLFQKIREDLGLAYSVYASASCYKDCGMIYVYAGANSENRDKAVEAIISEIKRFKKEGITDNEFLRGKEQLKSSLIFSQENTSSQMLLFGRYIANYNEVFSYEKKLKEIEAITKEDVNAVIEDLFDLENMASATVGPKRTSLNL